MAILKLKPFCRDTIWNGNWLKTEYGMHYDEPNPVEAWVLSRHPDGSCVIENGNYAGQALAQYIQAEGKGVLSSFGLIFCRFSDFDELH